MGSKGIYEEKPNPTAPNCHISLGLLNIIRKKTKITSSVSSARGKKDIGPGSSLPKSHWHTNTTPGRLYVSFLLSFAQGQPPLLPMTALYPGLNKDTFTESSLEVGRLVPGRLRALDVREIKPTARAYVHMCESKR